MKHSLFRVLASLLAFVMLAALAFAAVPAFAEDPDGAGESDSGNAGDGTGDGAEDTSATPTMMVFQTPADSMTLDGKVTQGEAWELVEWSEHPFEELGSKKAPAGSDIRFKVLWETNGAKARLWFLIDVNDDILNATERAWYQDNIRIFLDEDGVNEDNAKPQRDQANYGDIYASSEFMSYCPSGWMSRGFDWRAEKKEDGSGYVMEVQYTFQTPSRAVADAAVRANLTVVFADAENSQSPVQWLWSRDKEKWSAGLTDKEYFAHAGTLKLSGTMVKSDEERPELPGGNAEITAKQTEAGAVKLDGKATDSVWEQVDWSADAVAYRKMPVAIEGDAAYNEIYKSYAVRFKVLWAKDGSNSYLYFLIEVDDPNMTSESGAWASDNVRVFLDETGNAEPGTVAKRNRESAYASSEFMSYASLNNSTGFKYRSAKKKDGSGYLVEVQYTFAAPDLAVDGATMKLNVVANDADSANDDGAHYSQQFAWSWNSDLWSEYPQIDCIEHAGTLTLSAELVKPAETTGGDTGSGETPTGEVPTGTDEPGTGAQTSGDDTNTAGKGGCKSGIGLGMLPLLVLPLAGLAAVRRRKED